MKGRGGRRERSVEGEGERWEEGGERSVEGEGERWEEREECRR